MRQLEHNEIVNSDPSAEIVLVLDRIADMANVGMAFRLGDAFGVSKFYFPLGFVPEITQKLKRVSRSTATSIDIASYDNDSNLADLLKDEGYHILCLEVCDQSSDINTFDHSLNNKIALIIGSETSGVSAALIEKSDSVHHIKMFGKNSSINVITALGIALNRIQK